MNEHAEVDSFTDRRGLTEFTSISHRKGHVVFMVFFLVIFNFLFSPPVADASANMETQKFSLNFKDMPLGDVLKFLAEESGRNIIIPEGLSQKVTLNLDGIDLDEALKAILKSYGLSYVTETDIIRIVKLSDTAAAEEDLFMEIITLNYAKAAELATQVKTILSQRGTLSADERSNSLIMKDVKGRIQEAKRLIKELDARIPLILIKARIVEASDNFSRNLGIQWGGRYTSGNNSFTGGSELDISPGGNNYAVNLPVVGPTGGLGMSIGSIHRNTVLDIQLSAAEKRGEVKIVSTPRITTVNNMPATVSSGVEYSVKSLNENDNGSSGTSSTSESTLSSITAQTSLTVTPRVSADNYILLTIDASRDEPDFSRLVDGIPGITRKNAKTTVLVKDGDTTVIGGLYRNMKGETRDSVPFLSRIPVLGWLFKSKGNVEENEELLIFITPKILDKSGNS